MTALLGILMLDSRFPRILGDVGNPESWPFPVRYARVTGVSPERAVTGDPHALLSPFIATGRQLVAEGCTGIATTCGFLAPLRQHLADALGVPVAASALEQASGICATLPLGKRLGILTISKESLRPPHLEAAAVPPHTSIAGMEGTQFARTILGDRPELDVEVARSEMVVVARELKRAEADLGAILLECTNMVPYAPQVAQATGLPVYSIYTYLTWFHAGLAPRSFHCGARNHPS